MFDVHDEIAKLPGSIKARQLLVNKALTYLDLLAREPGADPALQLELAEAYLRVGGVQGQVGYNNLGDHAAALKSYNQGIALLEQALGKDPASRKESIQLARAYNIASADLEALGRPAEELAMISREIDLMQRRLGRVPGSVEVQARLGHAFFRRSQYRSGHSDPAGAKADAQGAVDLYEDIVTRDPQLIHRSDLAYAYSNLAEINLKGDAASRSMLIDSERRALATMRALAADRQDDVNIKRHLAVTAAELGAALVTVGRAREGLPYVEETLPIFQALYDADKSNRLARLDFAESQENTGTLWISLGDPTKAVDHCLAAVQLLGKTPEPPDRDLEISAALVDTQSALAEAYASAAEAGGTAPQSRTQWWREAQLSAAASLRTAQAIVAKKPEIAGDYAAFITKDKGLIARATRALGRPTPLRNPPPP
jgi:tetratricopeptide (TPR) repeat protein